MPASDVNVRTRVYGATGSVSETDVTSVFFGTVGPGMDSNVIVIDMIAEGAAKVANIRLGVVGGNLSDRDIGGVLLAESRTSFSMSKPSLWMPGFNKSGIGDDKVNLKVGVKESAANESNYVALMVRGPGRPISSGSMQFKWFFDFE